MLSFQDELDCIDLGEICYEIGKGRPDLTEWSRSEEEERLHKYGSCVSEKLVAVVTKQRFNKQDVLDKFPRFGPYTEQQKDAISEILLATDVGDNIEVKTIFDLNSRLYIRERTLRRSPPKPDDVWVLVFFNPVINKAEIKGWQYYEVIKEAMVEGEYPGKRYWEYFWKEEGALRDINEYKSLSTMQRASTT